jgi:hypothetical protein
MRVLGVCDGMGGSMTRAARAGMRTSDCPLIKADLCWWFGSGVWGCSGVLEDWAVDTSMCRVSSWSSMWKGDEDDQWWWCV